MDFWFVLEDKEKMSLVWFAWSEGWKMETVITYGWTATYLGAGWSYTIYILCALDVSLTFSYICSSNGIIG